MRAGVAPFISFIFHFFVLRLLGADWRSLPCKYSHQFYVTVYRFSHVKKLCFNNPCVFRAWKSLWAVQTCFLDPRMHLNSKAWRYEGLDIIRLLLLWLSQLRRSHSVVRVRPQRSTCPVACRLSVARRNATA